VDVYIHVFLTSTLIGSEWSAKRSLCHIIVLDIHAPTEDKTDDVKDSFYEELERVFHVVRKYHTKILLGDFNAKVGREDIFKPTIGNVSLHEISNDYGFRIVIIVTSTNVAVKNRMSPRRSIKKFTRISPDGKPHNQIDHILIDTNKQTNSMV
jgi:hypothetical protein